MGFLPLPFFHSVGGKEPAGNASGTRFTSSNVWSRRMMKNDAEFKANCTQPSAFARCHE